MIGEATVSNHECPTLSAPYSPAVDRETHRRQRNGSQPLRRADRLSLDSGQAARSPASLLRPSDGHRPIDPTSASLSPRLAQVSAGLPAVTIAAKGIYARVASASFTLAERKTRAWNTARASAHAPASPREKAPPASILPECSHGEPASKMVDRAGPVGPRLENPPGVSPKIPAFEFPRPSSRIFSAKTSDTSAVAVKP